MDCGNSYALNSYMEQIAKVENTYDMFLADISDDLDEMIDIIDRIKRLASDYEGYDFTDDLKDIIKDTIYV